MRTQHIDPRHPLVKKLNTIYQPLFRYQSCAIATNLTYLSLAFLVYNPCSSVNFSYKHLTDKCLNSFYYTSLRLSHPFRLRWLSHHKGRWLLWGEKPLIPSYSEKRKQLPRRPSFVILLIMVPVLLNGKDQYISVPVAHKIWIKNQTKLAIAALLYMKAYTYADKSAQYIVLCDSW